MNGSLSLISASKKIGLREVREKLLNWIFTDTLEKIMTKFPARRLRRYRQAKWTRDLVAESYTKLQ
jgi:hypothetical protein